MGAASTEPCVFCAIVSGALPSSRVHEDALTLAFVDLRQAQPGHVLVVPKAHLHDVRDLDASTGAALMATITRVTRAVGDAMPNEGITLWHSIGEAAFQEVPHLHVHIHPRRIGDGLLRAYPAKPVEAGRDALDALAARIRATLPPMQA